MDAWGKRRDMVVHEPDPYNAEPPQDALTDQVLTDIDTFYTRNHGAVPRLDPTTWRLRVDGLIDRQMELSLDDLHDRFDRRTVVATLQCAGNRRAGLLAVRDIPGEHPWGPGATSTAEWTGVALADVLDAGGVAAEARHVAFAAPDMAHDAEPPQAYGSSIEIDKAMGAEVLLAWQMNGAPLPTVHGAPVRVVVPGYIGARSVKWVQRVTAQAEPSANYFQATAYRLQPADADPHTAAPGSGFALGPVALNCAILRPDDGSVVAAGPTQVSGYAFAGGGRGVARVDVSGDGGVTWAQTDLDEQASPWAWRLWRQTIALQPGRAGIVARAWDTAAALQPESPEHVWNPKGYVNNSWSRVVLTVTAAPGQQD